MKKLYKSKKNKVFAGVVGGVGEYFNVDPVILRLAWLLVIALTGFVPGIVVYVISVFIVPNRSKK